jgi:hypothetical protein
MGNLEAAKKECSNKQHAAQLNLNDEDEFGNTGMIVIHNDID